MATKKNEKYKYNPVLDFNDAQHSHEIGNGRTEKDWKKLVGDRWFAVLVENGVLTVIE